jgi:xylulokinase
MSFPRPGWAEQDPQLWLTAVATTVRRLMTGLEAPRTAVQALSFGSQLDGVVMCGVDGAALRPAIIWLDRRATAEAALVASRISDEHFYRASGVNLDSSHGVFKALWVRSEERATFDATQVLLTPGSYVLRHATGEIAVDHSNASSLGLLDPRELTWSRELLDLAELDEELLAPLVPATADVGPVTSRFAEACGLDPGTRVACGCGDEMAATLGAGVHEVGEICDITGTAEPVCAVSTEPLFDTRRLVECHPHALPGLWLLENPGFVSGGNLRWWRDHFFPAGADYDGLVAEADEVPPGADGVVFLPCMQGAMAPEWNEHARGAFLGLTLAHSRGHLTRAILEGSAFALRDIVSAIRDAGLEPRRITAVGGGARSQLWRRIKADAVGLPVRVTADLETTATGAAVLAAIAIEPGARAEDVAERFVAYEIDEEQPDPTRARHYDAAYATYRRCYEALYGG